MNTVKKKSIILHFILGSFILMGAFPSLMQSSPENNLSALLEELKTYQQGENDSLILELNSMIRSQRATQQGQMECEKQLISFLSKQATQAGKMEACRHLRIIGTENSVPVLEEMLMKKEATDMARYALEKIPGPAPDKALLRGLQKSRGLIKAGIISTLGHRKSPQAVPYLEEIIHKNSDPTLSLAAAAALGHIQTSQAAEALLNVLLKTEGELKIQIAGSLLKCAEKDLSKGETQRAYGVYEQILNTDLPPSLHNSAFCGKIKAAGPRGSQLILENLRSKAKNIYPSCIHMIPEYFDSSQVKQLCSLIPELSESVKVPLISMLSHYSDPEVLETALYSAKSSNQEVRLASLNTLKQIGTSSTVDFLAQHSASSKGKEQQQARSSLWELKGKNIDKTIILNLEAEKKPEIQIEYIKAVEQRRIHSGKKILFDKINSFDPKVSLQAAKSIKVLTLPQDISRLIEHLMDTEDHQLKEEIINTIAFTALKIRDPLKRGEHVTKALAETKDPLNRSSLYLLLGRIGDDSTLPALRRGLNESDPLVQDAVVRAFSRWPAPTAAEDVLYLAQTSNKTEHQILCLRSYIKMIGMEPFRRPEAAVRSLERALDLAQRNSEKFMILGVLPEFPCEQGLKLAQRLAQDKDIEQEAKKAISLIQENMKKNNT